MINKFRSNVKSNTSKFKNNINKLRKGIVSFFKEKGKTKKIKKLFKMLWKYIKREDILKILLMALPFVLMDITTRLFGYKISFYSLFRLTPR